MGGAPPRSRHLGRARLRRQRPGPSRLVAGLRASRCAQGLPGAGDGRAGAAGWGDRSAAAPGAARQDPSGHRRRSRCARGLDCLPRAQRLARPRPGVVARRGAAAHRAPPSGFASTFAPSVHRCSATACTGAATRWSPRDPRPAWRCTPAASTSRIRPSRAVSSPRPPGLRVWPPSPDGSTRTGPRSQRREAGGGGSARPGPRPAGAGLQSAVRAGPGRRHARRRGTGAPRVAAEQSDRTGDRRSRRRVLAADDPGPQPWTSLGDAWADARLDASLAWRTAAGLVGPDATFRLAHGAGDALPGLFADVYGAFAVVSALTPALVPVAGALARRLVARGLADGAVVKHRGRGAAAQQAEVVVEVAGTAPPDRLVVREGRWRFEVHLARGVNVGLFGDMRAERLRLAGLSAGRRVLNLFAYTGTLSVAAATGGASRVTSVDLSEGVLAWARDNAALNDVPVERFHTVAADARRFVGSPAAIGESFDLVLVDPPSFSTARDAEFAIDRDYPGLVTEVCRLVVPWPAVAGQQHARLLAGRSGPGRHRGGRPTRAGRGRGAAAPRSPDRAGRRRCPLPADLPATPDLIRGGWRRSSPRARGPSDRCRAGTRPAGGSASRCRARRPGTPSA